MAMHADNILLTLCAAPRAPRRTRVMGIVNVTPDSFSDGGRHAAPDAAVEHALRLAEAGADMLDIGGESSRPGSLPVGEAEEMDRVLPVIEKLRARSGTPLSLDTTKAAVAEAGLRLGIRLINDITALRGDSAMAGVIARHDAWVCLMHMQGAPRTMQQDPRYADAAGEITAFLYDRAAAAIAAGIDRHRIMLDPGIGFGKTAAHNIALLSRVDWAALEYPVLIGASRKAFIGALTGESNPAARDAGSLAAAAVAVSRGAAIVRVHDAGAAADFFAVHDTLTSREAAHAR